MLDYLKKHWKGLLTSIVIAELVGLISNFLSGNASDLYTQLKLPPFSPPGWLFGVVWPILYALMGIAAYLVYAQENSQSKDTALSLYNTQLIFNFMWSIVFFRFQLYWGSVMIIILLDILVFLTIQTFKHINPKAAWLLIPYLIWILFATYLNIGIALLN